MQCVAMINLTIQYNPAKAVNVVKCTYVGVSSPVSMSDADISRRYFATSFACMPLSGCSDFTLPFEVLMIRMQFSSIST